MYCISFAPARASTLLYSRNKALNYWIRTGKKSECFIFNTLWCETNERVARIYLENAKDVSYFFLLRTFPIFFAERETKRHQRHRASGNFQFECVWFLMKKRNSIQRKGAKCEVRQERGTRTKDIRSWCNHTKWSSSVIYWANTYFSNTGICEQTHLTKWNRIHI